MEGFGQPPARTRRHPVGQQQHIGN